MCRYVLACYHQGEYFKAKLETNKYPTQWESSSTILPRTGDLVVIKNHFYKKFDERK